MPLGVVAGLGQQGEAVLVQTADSVPGRKVFGSFGHAVGAPGLRHPGVDEAPADGGVVNLGRAGEGGFGLGHHEGRAGHAFDAACDDDLRRAVADAAGGKDHGIKAGRAEAVHRQCRNRGAKAGQEDGHPGDVAVILARLVGAAEDHLVDGQVVQIEKAVDDPGGKVVGADCGQRPGVAADGGATVGAKEGLGHVATRPGAGS